LGPWITAANHLDLLQACKNKKGTGKASQSKKKQKASSKPVSAKKPKSAKPKSAAKKDAGKKSVKAKKDASIQKTKAHSDTAYGLAKKVFSARKLDCAYLKSLSHFPNLFMNALMDFDGWFT
jgi:hypothetical protein